MVERQLPHPIPWQLDFYKALRHMSRVTVPGYVSSKNLGVDIPAT